MRGTTILALFLTVAASAGADEWQRLGSRQVNFRAERDTIAVGASAGRFTRLKVDVDQGNLEMYDIRVVFENGEAYSPTTRVQFHDDSRSRTLDLPGEARAIDRVEFRYRSRRERGVAVVTLFGKAADGGSSGRKGEPGGAAAEPAGAWDLLGERLVSFEAERDTIPVTGREGRYRALRLEVEGGNVDLYNLRVTFGDGDHYSPETRLEFRQGAASRTIDLPGGARVIRMVEFWYRSELKRGRGTVRVFGLTGSATAGGSTAGGGGAGASTGGGSDTPAAGPDATAGRGAWERLGAREVSFATDHDTIAVTASEGKFTQIKLDVDEGNLELYNLRVVFGDGDAWSPDTRLQFGQGSRSRTIDLPGGARVLRTVEFWYRSERGRGRAIVTLLGKRVGGADGDKDKVTPAREKDAPATGGADKPPASGDAKNRHPGWDYLAGRTVSFGADRDAISLRSEGRFTALRVDVQDGDLEMFDVVIHFANGDTFSPKTRLVFDQGSRTRDLDLPGKARAIDRIVFAYRSKSGGRDGRATIRLYGRK